MTTEHGWPSRGQGSARANADSVTRRKLPQITISQHGRCARQFDRRKITNSLIALRLGDCCYANFGSMAAALHSAVPGHNLPPSSESRPVPQFWIDCECIFAIYSGTTRWGRCNVCGQSEQLRLATAKPDTGLPHSRRSTACFERPDLWREQLKHPYSRSRNRRWMTIDRKSVV